MSTDSFDDLWDETDEDRQGQLEHDTDQIVDTATCAKSREELAAEIEWLKQLVEQASVVHCCPAILYFTAHGWSIRSTPDTANYQLSTSEEYWPSIARRIKEVRILGVSDSKRKYPSTPTEVLY